MGLLDKVKSAVSKNPDKARGAIDKAATMAEKKAGRKHRGNIDKVATKAKGFVDGGTARPAEGRTGRAGRRGGTTGPTR